MYLQSQAQELVIWESSWDLRLFRPQGVSPSGCSVTLMDSRSVVVAFNKRAACSDWSPRQAVLSLLWLAHSAAGWCSRPLPPILCVLIGLSLSCDGHQYSPNPWLDWMKPPCHKESGGQTITPSFNPHFYKIPISYAATLGTMVPWQKSQATEKPQSQETIFWNHKVNCLCYYYVCLQEPRSTGWVVYIHVIW